MDPSSFTVRRAVLSTGHSYEYVDQQPEHNNHTKSILCVHGFPDLWYGWRHQIVAWVQAGYRVIAPNMLGYGRSDKPRNIAEYTTKSLANDLAALLDVLGIAKTVVVGHDWGAATVWRFALYHPQRIQALVVISIPYTPPALGYISIEETAKRVPSLGYQVYFADEKSTEEIERNLETFVDTIFRLPPMDSFSTHGKLQSILDRGKDVHSPPQALLSDMERAHYLSEFKKGGMLGPLSYYRTTRLRFEEEKNDHLSPELSSTFPVLFFYGTEDPSCPPKNVDRMHKFIKRLRVVKLQDKGHWVMVESKEVISNEVINFISSLESKL